MSVCHPLYKELFQFVLDLLPKLPHPARKRLVWLVFGIVITKSIVLNRIAAEQAAFGGGSVDVESHERRLRRIENDPHLTWRETYAPAVRRVVKWRHAKPPLILIDESGHSDVFRTLVAALWYRGRAIPLTWVSWPAQVPLTVSYWHYVDMLLAMLAEIVPQGLRVMVIGDRAFGNPAFTDRVAARGWDWLVRIQRQTCFRDCQGRRWPVSQILPQRGRWKGRGQVFKKQGWREASLVAFWDHRHREPLFVASSLPPSWELIRLYLQRGAIECLFRDWKSMGWQLETSQVTDLAHWSVLLVGLAWATLLTLCLGAQQAEGWLSQPARPRRTLPRAGKRSLFQLGLERTRARLYRTVEEPVRWELSEFEAPNWSQQIRNYHGRAYVFAHTQGCARSVVKVTRTPLQ